MSKFLPIILASLFLISACGQKGPLYLPDSEPSKQVGQGEENAGEKEDSEDPEESGNTGGSSSEG